MPNQVKSDLIFNERLTDFSVDICSCIRALQLVANGKNRYANNVFYEKSVEKCHENYIIIVTK